VMLCAFVAMNARGMSFKGAGKAYYIWCAMLFLSNGMYATILNLQESTMGPGQNSEMVITAYLGTAVIVSLAQTLSGRGKKLAQGLRMGKKAALFALGSSTCATVAANLCLYLLGLVEASVLYTIDNGGVLVMSAICSCVLFRERLRWEQILGVVLAALSIVMITQG